MNDPEVETIIASNSQAFFAKIADIVEEQDISYMDAVIHYCEKEEIEIESVAKVIKSNVTLKTLIQNEGEELNFLKKTAKLPI